MQPQVLVVVKNCAEHASDTRSRFATDEMLGVLYDLLEGTERTRAERRASQTVVSSDRAMGERLMCQACDTLQELCGDAAVRERVCLDGAASKALKLLDNHSHSPVVQAVGLKLIARLSQHLPTALDVIRHGGT
jgi:hypothetical protein